jgi:hypothetical protein
VVEQGSVNHRRSDRRSAQSGRVERRPDLRRQVRDLPSGRRSRHERIPGAERQSSRRRRGSQRDDRDGVSRYHLALDALRRAEESSGYSVPAGARSFCDDALQRHSAYIREHGCDLPEVTDWQWR